MEAREIYKQKYEAQMHEWSAKLDVMKAKTEKLTAEAKLEMLPKIQATESKLEAAKAKLADLAEATGDKWDDVTKGLEGFWVDIKASAEGAAQALEKHRKN